MLTYIVCRHANFQRIALLSTVLNNIRLISIIRVFFALTRYIIIWLCRIPRSDWLIRSVQSRIRTVVRVFRIRTGIPEVVLSREKFEMVGLTDFQSNFTEKIKTKHKL